MLDNSMPMVAHSILVLERPIVVENVVTIVVVVETMQVVTLRYAITHYRNLDILGNGMGLLRQGTVLLVNVVRRLSPLQWKVLSNFIENTFIIECYNYASED